MNVVGKSFNGSLYVISDDPTDNDSSHIASIVAVNKLYNSLNKIYKPGDLYFSLVDEEIDGFILGQGQEISRTTYADLFARYGTKFGEGDGETTFKLPDFRGLFLEGANGNLGSYIEAGLPNIVFDTNTILLTSGASVSSGVKTRVINYIASGINTEGARGVWGFDASLSNSIYGNSTTVQPPAITVNVFIKY